MVPGIKIITCAFQEYTYATELNKTERKEVFPEPFQETIITLTPKSYEDPSKQKNHMPVSLIQIQSFTTRFWHIKCYKSSKTFYIMTNSALSMDTRKVQHIKNYECNILQKEKQEYNSNDHLNS